MTEQTPLIDRKRLANARARAKRAGGDFFLHEEARFEVDDRLSLVNKTFRDVAVVTGFPELWKKWFPEATVIADDDVLDLPLDSFDLVVHAMALHWSNDPVGQIIQCNRALRPDGLFLAVFLGDQTLNELRSSLAEAEVQLTAGLSPRVLPMGELGQMGGLLQRASLALPVADKLSKTVTYRNLRHLVGDLRAMGETASLSATVKSTPHKQLFNLTDDIYMSNFSEGGRLNATFDFVCLTGWAPDKSQPKPLLPGSAKSRLADALKTEELKLPRT